MSALHAMCTQCARSVHTVQQLGQSGLRWASSMGKISRNIREVPHCARTMRALRNNPSVYGNTILTPVAWGNGLQMAYFLHSAGQCTLRPLRLYVH